MFRVDLHTHSVASYDGGITEEGYRESIAKKVLDYIAITDHNRIDFAQALHKKLGNHIIIGEEIQTTEGEVIAVFLNKKVEPYQPFAKTIKDIKFQKGLVYIPHPFDPARYHVTKDTLQHYVKAIDIVETFNGRMFWKKANARALDFAMQNKCIMAASSDAHARMGLGNAYTIIKEPAMKDTLKRAIKSGELVQQYQPLLGYLAPAWNKLRNRFKMYDL